MSLVGASSDVNALVSTLRNFGIDVHGWPSPRAIMYLAAALPHLIHAASSGHKVEVYFPEKDEVTITVNWPMWNIFFRINDRGVLTTLSFFQTPLDVVPVLLPLLSRPSVKEYFRVGLEKLPYASICAELGIPLRELDRLLSYLSEPLRQKVVSAVDIIGNLLATAKTISERVYKQLHIPWLPTPTSRRSRDIVEEVYSKQSGPVRIVMLREVAKLDLDNTIRDIVNYIAERAEIPLWIFVPTLLDIYIVPDVDTARTFIYLPLPSGDDEEDTSSRPTYFLTLEEPHIVCLEKDIGSLRSELLRDIAKYIKYPHTNFLRELGRKYEEEAIVPVQHVPTWLERELRLSPIDRALIRLYRDVLEEFRTLW